VVIEVDPAAPAQREGAPVQVAPPGQAASAGQREHSPGRPPEPAGERAPRARSFDRPDSRSYGDRPHEDRPYEDRPEGHWRGAAVSWEEDDAPDRDLTAIEESLEEIVSLLDLRLEIAIREEEGEREEERIEVELSGADSDALLARDGALLDAIEHLLPRMVRGLAGHAVPCRLDSGGFRAAHREEMRELAEEVAEEVRRDLQSQILEPMSPADRRLVHMALAEDPAVRTESEGGGFMKRVRISPV